MCHVAPNLRVHQRTQQHVTLRRMPARCTLSINMTNYWNWQPITVVFTVKAVCKGIVQQASGFRRRVANVMRGADTFEHVSQTSCNGLSDLQGVSQTSCNEGLDAVHMSRSPQNECPFRRYRATGIWIHKKMSSNKGVRSQRTCHRIAVLCNK